MCKCVKRNLPKRRKNVIFLLRKHYTNDIQTDLKLFNCITSKTKLNSKLYVSSVKVCIPSKTFFYLPPSLLLRLPLRLPLQLSSFKPSFSADPIFIVLVHSDHVDREYQPQQSLPTGFLVALRNNHHLEATSSTRERLYTIFFSSTRSECTRHGYFPEIYSRPCFFFHSHPPTHRGGGSHQSFGTSILQ